MKAPHFAAGPGPHVRSRTTAQVRKALADLSAEVQERLPDYAGLWHTHPGLAMLMAVVLLSLGGLLPTAGFIAKWYVFSAAVSAGYSGLAIVGISGHGRKAANAWSACMVGSMA
jgi:NADH:ubiquinone oxidoreductase subunit 2 (subunit N)